MANGNVMLLTVRALGAPLSLEPWFVQETAYGKNAHIHSHKQLTHSHKHSCVHQAWPHGHATCATMRASNNGNLYKGKRHALIVPVTPYTQTPPLTTMDEGCE